MRNPSSTLKGLFGSRQGKGGYCLKITVTGLDPHFGEGVDTIDKMNKWYFTTFQTPVTISGDVYAPTAIGVSIGKDKESGILDSGGFTISGARIEPFVTFVGSRTAFDINCDLYEVFFDAAGTPWADLLISGTIIKATQKSTGVSVDFREQINWMQKKVPAIAFGLLDQRVAYTAGFGIDINDTRFRTNAVTALTVNQNAITSVAANAFDGNGTPRPSYYARGLALYIRTVKGVDNIARQASLMVPIIDSKPSLDPAHPEQAIFILQYPPPFLDSQNNIFDVIAGYDGSYFDAAVTFANKDLGWGAVMFPDMPVENPSLITYG